VPPLGRENFGGSVRVAKISRSHRPALAPPGVARRSPPTRIGRPEVKTNQCFSQNGAQRSSSRGTPKVACRRAGVTFPPATCSRGTPTDLPLGYRRRSASTTTPNECSVQQQRQQPALMLDDIITRYSSSASIRLCLWAVVCDLRMSRTNQLDADSFYESAWGILNFAIVYPAKAAKHRADSRSNALFLMTQDDLFLSHHLPVGRRRDHTRSCRRKHWH